MKKIFSIILCLTLLLSNVQLANASSTNTQKEKVTMVKKLEAFEKTKDIEINYSYTGETIATFENFEDFEVAYTEMLKNVEEKYSTSENISEKLNISVENSVLKNSISRTNIYNATTSSYSYYTGHKIITWWSPFTSPTWHPLASLFNQKEVEFNYKYHFENSAPRFDSITNVVNRPKGILVGVVWQQVTDRTSISITNGSNYTKATINTGGILTLGVVIGGTTVGIPFNIEMNTYYKLYN